MLRHPLSNEEHEGSVILGKEPHAHGKAVYLATNASLYLLMLCLICTLREADATGSHLIPHSVLESMSNDGVKGRDVEQNFQLGA